VETLPDFVVRHAGTVAEAVALLAAEPNARLLAGGTDLVPNLRRGLEAPAVLVDLGAATELRVLRADTDGLEIGAGVTLAALAAHAGIARTHPAIVEAARAVAGPGHRAVATVGGNLCLDTRCVYYNQSAWWRAANGYCMKRGGEVCHVAPQGNRCHAAFSGDLAPALIALDARVEVRGAAGARTIPLAELYADDGAAHLRLARDEVLVGVRVPATALVSGYRKARVRAAMDFPLAGVAVALGLDAARGALSALRVALTGTNSRPLLLAGADELLGRRADDATLGALGKLVQKQAGSMRTTVVASNYRRQVAVALAKRLVAELAELAAGTRP
jgi:4-hydroxybenzoyl-CoA reductase subunit beta